MGAISLSCSQTGPEKVSCSLLPASFAAFFSGGYPSSPVSKAPSGEQPSLLSRRTPSLFQSRSRLATRALLTRGRCWPPALLLLAPAAEYRPTTIISMQFKRESHPRFFILEISLNRCPPTTWIPPLLNGHTLLLHRFENTEFGLHAALILDKAVKSDSFLKFWTLIPVRLFELLVDEGVSIAGKGLPHNLSFGDVQNADTGYFLGPILPPEPKSSTVNQSWAGRRKGANCALQYPSD